MNQKTENFLEAFRPHIGPGEQVSDVGTVLGDIVTFLSTVGFRSRYQILKDAKINFTQFERALPRGGESFSPENEDRLLGLVNDEKVREHFRARLSLARLLRRGILWPHRLQGSSLAELLHRSVALQSDERAKFWWTFLFQIMNEADLEPFLPRWSDMSMLSRTLIDVPRRTYGEKIGLRNSLILLESYLAQELFESTNERLALLNVMYLTMDLAAQVNDARLLRYLWTLLDRIKINFVGETERLLCKRMILDCKSREVRYRSDFYNSAANIREPVKLAAEATRDAGRGIKESSVASDWPDLYYSWIGACFNYVNTGFTAGLGREQMKELLLLHDDIGTKASGTSPGQIALTDAVHNGVGANLYMVDVMVQHALVRSDPHKSLAKARGDKEGPDPDLAIHYIIAGLTNMRPADHFGDTIVAHLKLDYVEALLCKYDGAWSRAHIEEYRELKSQVNAALVPFGMKQKLARLERLERIARLPPIVRP